MPLDTAQVLQSHLDALMARDVERIMADYDEEAFIITNLVPGAIFGTEAMREFWVQSLEIFTPDLLARVKIEQQVIARDVAYVVWSAGPMIPFASDTFVVRDGRIIAQTGSVLISQAH